MQIPSEISPSDLDSLFPSHLFNNNNMNNNNNNNLENNNNNNLFTVELPSSPYVLTAVINHHGSMAGGHYTWFVFIFIFILFLSNL